MADEPSWNVAIINGQPEVVINDAALREMVKLSPYGEAEARRLLIERGVPAEMFDDEETS